MNKQNQKILIIEDEKTLSDAMSKKLGEEGFDIHVAYDGEDGLKKALDVKPDLILLDIILPKLDGMTLLERLRRDDWGKTVPVIILSNLSDDEKVLEAQQESVNDYLIKTDWSLEDVVNMVKEKLG